MGYSQDKEASLAETHAHGCSVTEPFCALYKFLPSLAINTGKDDWRTPRPGNTSAQILPQLPDQ
jgi:hypothetical protein